MFGVARSRMVRDNFGMKGATFDRYERTGDGFIAIDVAAERVEHLYNDFDKSAPYIRRDLDHDLVDYLIECASELKGKDFVLRFTLEKSPDEENLVRIRRSVNAYFLYLERGEQRRVLQMFRRAAILFCIGLGIFFLAVSVNRALGADRSVVANVFAEGLTVAAWVSLWESLAVFLVEWFPLRANLAMYRRLGEAEVRFQG